MEKDPEVKGDGNSYTTEFRQYDPRLGRWLTHDPVFKPHESPYASNGNNPIWFVDPSGADSSLASGGTTWQWTVSEGETYTSISGRTGVPVEDLRYFNQDNGAIADDYHIPIGMVINISDPGCSAPSSTPDIVLPDGVIHIREYDSYRELTEICLEFIPNKGVNQSDYVWFQTFRTNDPKQDDNGVKLDRSSPDRQLYPNLVNRTDNIAGNNYYNLNRDGNISAVKNNRYPTLKPKSNLLFANSTPLITLGPGDANKVGHADTPYRRTINNGQVVWEGTLMLCKKVDGEYILYKTFTYRWTMTGDNKIQESLIFENTNPGDTSYPSTTMNSFLNH